jgi:arylsulfate sulfotransferase
VADNGTHTRLMGLDPDHNVVFDFEYPTTPCTTSWNAVPLPLQAMTFE